MLHWVGGQADSRSPPYLLEAVSAAPVAGAFGEIDLEEESSYRVILSYSIIPLLGGSSHDLYVVNNHGDPKSPKDCFVGPLPNGLNGL